MGLGTARVVISFAMRKAERFEYVKLHKSVAIERDTSVNICVKNKQCWFKSNFPRQLRKTNLTRGNLKKTLPPFP